MILGRNELAKWHKRNLTSTLRAPLKYKQPIEKIQNTNFLDFLDGSINIEDIRNCEDPEEPLLVHNPPLITRTSECKNCFQRLVCSLTALSIEDVHPQAPKRKGAQG